MGVADVSESAKLACDLKTTSNLPPADIAFREAGLIFGLYPSESFAISPQQLVDHGGG